VQWVSIQRTVKRYAQIVALVIALGQLEQLGQLLRCVLYVLPAIRALVRQERPDVRFVLKAHTLLVETVQPVLLVMQAIPLRELPLPELINQFATSVRSATSPPMAARLAQAQAALLVMQAIPLRELPLPELINQFATSVRSATSPPMAARVAQAQAALLVMQALPLR